MQREVGETGEAGEYGSQTGNNWIEKRKDARRDWNIEGHWRVENDRLSWERRTTKPLLSSHEVSPSKARSLRNRNTICIVLFCILCALFFPKRWLIAALICF